MYLNSEYDKRILFDVRSYLSLNYNENDRIRIYKLRKNDKVYGLLFINDELIFMKEYNLNNSFKVNVEFNMDELEELVVEPTNTRKI